MTRISCWPFVLFEHGRLAPLTNNVIPQVVRRLTDWHKPRLTRVNLSGLRNSRFDKRAGSVKTDSAYESEDKSVQDSPSSADESASRDEPVLDEDSDPARAAQRGTGPGDRLSTVRSAVQATVQATGQATVQAAGQATVVSRISLGTLKSGYELAGVGHFRLLRTQTHQQEKRCVQRLLARSTLTA